MSAGQHTMEFHFEHNQLPGSLELAYLGDTVYDLYVRSHLVQRGGRVRALHRASTGFVCAHAQSEALRNIEEMLTEAEAGVVRRARNTKMTPPRNADAGEYHRATALEALIGYLYVRGEKERLNELLEKALPSAVIEKTEAK